MVVGHFWNKCKFFKIPMGEIYMQLLSIAALKCPIGVSGEDCAEDWSLECTFCCPIFCVFVETSPYCSADLSQADGCEPFWEKQTFLQVWRGKHTAVRLIWMCPHKTTPKCFFPLKNPVCMGLQQKPAVQIDDWLAPQWHHSKTSHLNRLSSIALKTVSYQVHIL